MNTLTAVVRVVFVGERRNTPLGGPTFTFIGTDLLNPEVQFYVKMYGEKAVRTSEGLGLDDIATVMGVICDVHEGRVVVKARAAFPHIELINENDEALA